MKKKIKIIFELTKIKITSFVAVTTAFGYLCAADKITYEIILPVSGILFIACGSAVINHYQERHTDALMERTKNRPIPSGRISASNALIISILMILIGTIILYTGSGTLALGLALLNLFWYNGVYTPLKKKNPLAIIPGSLVGAIPPAVGWVAGGGSLFAPQILIISLFFFIWQIPHFWLLLLVLNKDYERAGFPTLTQIFNHEQLARITFMWIVATAVTCILIPLFGVVKIPFFNYGLLAAGIWLTWKAFKLLKSKEKMNFRFAFVDINIFALTVVALVSIEKLFLLL